jgi:PleD family two-component response regulator
VLPNTRIDGAIVLAEAFRASVSSLGILGSSNDTDVSIGINQGVATTIPTNDMLSKKLLEAAEEALKKSISEGSNQINCKSI